MHLYIGWGERNRLACSELCLSLMVSLNFQVRQNNRGTLVPETEYFPVLFVSSIAIRQYCCVLQLPKRKNRSTPIALSIHQKKPGSAQNLRFTLFYPISVRIACRCHEFHPPTLSHRHQVLVCFRFLFPGKRHLPFESLALIF